MTGPQGVVRLRRLDTVLPPTRILLLDETDQSGFDGLAAASALFGHGRLALYYVDDRGAVSQEAQRLAVDVVVVDVDNEVNPKETLANIVGDDPDLRVVVLTEGHPAVIDGALAVGASGCLLKALPASELVAHLAQFAQGR